MKQLMEAELGSVLADPAFARSPVLRRLLTFLVAATLHGKGKKLKSYTVAVDGLGRDDDYDPQTNTYARVQVIRLRRALERFYAGPGFRNSHRLTIGNGSYEVQLVSGSEAHAALGASVGALKKKPGMSSRTLALVGAIVLSLAAIAACFHIASSNQQAKLRWQADDFPRLAVNVMEQSGVPENGVAANRLKADLQTQLSRYEGIVIDYGRGAKTTYALNVELRRSGISSSATTHLVDQGSNELMWSETRTISAGPELTSADNSEYVRQTAFAIAHGAGIVHAAERSKVSRSDSPYHCWLRFAAQIQESRFGADAELSSCAEHWHETAPDHPIASGLRVWTLLDQSVVALTQGRREELIDEAIGEIQHARAVNPGSGFLAAVAVRAFALAHQDQAMREAGEQALSLNPGNLEVQGLVGSMFTLRGDPRGEPLLDRAIAGRTNPPPWYFVAKFFAAMMREDTSQAKEALVRLDPLEHSLPVVPVLKAAYEARLGQVDRARIDWARARSIQPLLRFQPDIVISRTPLGPKAAQRLKEWLAPVLR